MKTRKHILALALAAGALFPVGEAAAQDRQPDKPPAKEPGPAPGVPKPSQPTPSKPEEPKPQRPTDPRRDLPDPRPGKPDGGTTR